MIPKARRYALERSKKAADIAGELGCDLMVLWLAREGTYLRESKNVVRAAHQLLEAINTILDYSPKCALPSSPSPTSRWTWPTSPPWGMRWRWAFRRAIPNGWAC